MNLWSKVICNRGHVHKVMHVFDLILPYYCTVEDAQEAQRMKSQRDSNKCLQPKKSVVRSKNNSH